MGHQINGLNTPKVTFGWRGKPKNTPKVYLLSCKFRPPSIWPDRPTVECITLGYWLDRPTYERVVKQPREQIKLSREQSQLKTVKRTIHPKHPREQIKYQLNKQTTNCSGS